MASYWLTVFILLYGGMYDFVTSQPVYLFTLRSVFYKIIIL